MRRAARHALNAADEETTRLAHRVTVAASAWLGATPANDAEAYRRLDRVIDDWDAYAAPVLDEPVEELLDQLADASAPVALAEVVADIAPQFRRAREDC